MHLFLTSAVVFFISWGRHLGWNSRIFLWVSNIDSSETLLRAGINTVLAPLKHEVSIFQPTLFEGKFTQYKFLKLFTKEWLVNSWTVLMKSKSKFWLWCIFGHSNPVAYFDKFEKKCACKVRNWHMACVIFLVILEI